MSRRYLDGNRVAYSYHSDHSHDFDTVSVFCVLGIIVLLPAELTLSSRSVKISLRP